MIDRSAIARVDCCYSIREVCLVAGDSVSLARGVVINDDLEC